MQNSGRPNQKSIRLKLFHMFLGMSHGMGWFLNEKWTHSTSQHDLLYGIRPGVDGTYYAITIIKNRDKNLCTQ